MAETLESTGNYIPKDLRITAQPDAVDKDKFKVVATGLKIDETYVFQFQYVFEDDSLSEWSPGYTLNTQTETVPGAPSASVPSTSVGNIPVTLSTFPVNAKRVDIYVIGGIYGTGKVVDHFLAAGTKTISISDAGVYQVSLITVTPSGINGDPTNTFTITVTGQQQVVEAPTLPTGLTVSSAPFAVAVNWGGQYSGSNFEGFKSIDVHVRGSDVGATSTSGFSTTTQVATLTVNSTTNRQNIGLDNIRQALALASNELAYTTPLFFYYIARNENDELYKVGGVATYTRINSSTVNPTKANFVDLENGVISIENLVAGNGQFSSWLRTGSVGGARIELSGTNDFTPSGESIVVKKGITAYSTGSTEIFRLDIGSTPKLTIKGDGEFTGDLSIGTGNNIFKAEPATGIWLGNSAFASAPFSVSKTGILTAQSGTIGGWSIDSTKLRSNTSANSGSNQITFNPATPKIALTTGNTLNATTGFYEGGTEKITFDPVEGIVGPDITYNGSQVPSFKLTPSGNLTLYGSITVTGGNAATTDLVNTKNKTFYQNDAPTNPISGYSLVAGDIWFDTNDGFRQYRWSGSAWQDIRDAGIETAVNDAALAKSKADTSLQIGGNEIRNPTTNQITTINSTGITITGSTFSLNGAGTATTPAANSLVINSNGITAQNSSGQTTFAINASTGDAEFRGTVTGSEIIGSSIKTATSGNRLEITTGGDLQFYSIASAVPGSITSSVFSINGLFGVMEITGPTTTVGWPAPRFYMYSFGSTTNDYGTYLFGNMEGRTGYTTSSPAFRNIRAGASSPSGGLLGDVYIQI